MTFCSWKGRCTQTCFKKWQIEYGRRCEWITEFRNRNGLMAGTSDWSGQISPALIQCLRWCKTEWAACTPCLKTEMLKNWKIRKSLGNRGWPHTHTRAHTHKHIYEYTLHIHDLDRFGPFSRGWFGWKSCTLAVTFYMDMNSFFLVRKLPFRRPGFVNLSFRRCWIATTVFSRKWNPALLVVVSLQRASANASVIHT